MSTAKKYNWLVITVILLALINLASLGFIWFNRPDRPRGQQPADARNFLISELKLSNDQVKEFDSLRTVHFKKIESYKEEMHHLKDDFFYSLKSPQDTMASDMANKIGMVQSKMELATFLHFAALRSICSDVQKQKFDQIIQEVLRNMGRGSEGPPPQRVN